MRTPIDWVDRAMDEPVREIHILRLSADSTLRVLENHVEVLMRVRVIVYVFLCAVMVVAKTGAGGVASGNGNDLLANLLGLVLLLPWVIVMPIFFEKININSTEWFFGFACLNIFLWTAYEYWRSYRAKKQSE